MSINSVIGDIISLIWLDVTGGVLPVLTIRAIVEIALEYLDEAEEILIVNPKASEELSRIADQNGTKLHKRFAYDRKNKKGVLVESNRIAAELEHEEIITVDVR